MAEVSHHAGREGSREAREVTLPCRWARSRDGVSDLCRPVGDKGQRVGRRAVTGGLNVTNAWRYAWDGRRSVPIPTPLPHGSPPTRRLMGDHSLPGSPISRRGDSFPLAAARGASRRPEATASNPQGPEAPAPPTRRQILQSGAAN